MSDKHTVDGLMELVANAIADGPRYGPWTEWVIRRYAQRLAAQPGEPVAWSRQRFIHDSSGLPIGTDDPEIAWGKEPPDDDGCWGPLYASPHPQQGEKQAARPDILERLSYHRLERDDLTLEDCLSYLANGWRDVHGRTERQMVMQILELLASGTQQGEKEASGVVAPLKKQLPMVPTNHMMNAAVNAWHSWKSRDSGGNVQLLGKLMWEHMADAAPEPGAWDDASGVAGGRQWLT